MTSVGRPDLLHPADAKLLRVLLIYVLPGLAVFYVVLPAFGWCRIIFQGCTATTMVTGRRGTLVASWNGVDFSISVRYLRSPARARRFSPICRGSIRDALALAMPAPLPLQHLVRCSSI